MTLIRPPWTAIESLPLLRNIAPARFALLAALFAGLLLAVALDGLWWDWGWWRRVLAVATGLVVLAFLAPSSPLQPRPAVATPQFFTTSAVATLPRDEVALVVLFPQKGRANRAMLWQTQAGMWFKMPGGYFVGPGPDGAALREAPPQTTSLDPRPHPAGGAPPRPDPGPAPADGRGLRQAGGSARWSLARVAPLAGPWPASSPTYSLGRAPQRLAGVELWGDASVAP